MQKVIIIGCPGSGKSTFARKLQEMTNLPLVHLDMLYWNADKTTVERDVFDRRLAEVLQAQKWIIDGNYARTMERRIQACDTVIFLDYPTEVCLEGIATRAGKPRPDMPWVENGETDTEFIDFINKYNTENRPEVIRLLQKYEDKNIVIFRTRAEADAYLAKPVLGGKTMKEIQTSNAPAAIGPYSQAIVANGLVFTSGQIPVNPQTGEIPEGIEAQANQVFTNLKNLLDASGTGIDKVIKTTVFIQNMDDFAVLNGIYETYFTAPYPARSCVEVAKLPKGVLVEVEAVAELN